ncbi:MAG: hypothetical protein BGP04_24125 [Rhizobiales bacterium 62-17]|nr:pseudouridine synthase [Hyphomicrobiales bacterium]OJY01237.1 MAG: hypothetical protein BGP04_24125 [Rhizobiales bacterium 62-17]
MTRDTDHEGRGRRKPGAPRPGASKARGARSDSFKPGASKPGFSKSGFKRPRTNAAPAESAHDGERIAKVMARAGLCSRRDAELWVAEGRVAVNGTVLDSPARNVTEKDLITVDGKPLAQRERTRLFLFHKPRGLVTTDKDPEGRPTIFEALPPELPRVVSIGRLDINTEGLLLLTNDGGLARVLELPATGWLRRYRVRAFGETDQSILDRLSEGVTIDGVDYRGIEAHIDRMQGDNVWITMGLREGKNREIKRVLEHLGLQVNRLIRISYGPFQLGELGEGAIEEIRTRVLKDQLGEKLAEDAGADFEAPIFSPDADRTRERRGRFVEEEPGPAEPHSPDRKRKHVSTLRDERTTQNAKGARKRVTRDNTQDRHGRAVTVERVTPAERPKRGKGASSRNARRFAEAAGGERPMRKPGARPTSDAPAPYVAGRGQGRSDVTRGDRNQEGGERPQRRFERGGDRPARGFAGAGDRPRFEKRDGPRGDRPTRGEGPSRFSRDGDRPRFDRPDGTLPSRAPRTEGRPRFSRDGDAPREGRSARGAPSGDRPRFEKRDGPRREPRGEGRSRIFREGEPPVPYRPAPSDRPRFEKRDGPRGERPARGEGPSRFSRDGDRPRTGDRPAGKFGGKFDGKFDGKPGGGRPSGGRPSGGGRPGGKPGGRPSGKPGGRPPRGDR